MQGASLQFPDHDCLLAIQSQYPWPPQWGAPTSQTSGGASCPLVSYPMGRLQQTLSTLPEQGTILTTFSRVGMGNMLRQVVLTSSARHGWKMAL